MNAKGYLSKKTKITRLGTALLCAVLLPVSGARASEIPVSVDSAAVSQTNPRLDKWLERHPYFRDKADQNQDGIVDSSELESARKLMKEHREQRREQWFKDHPEALKKLDVNGDGMIDKEEKKKAREQFRAARKKKRDQWLEKHPEIRQKLDTNGDGQLDKSEWEKGRKTFFENHSHERERRGPKGDRHGGWRERKETQQGLKEEYLR